jgi:D-Tyr-tRNAtyr deacylase
VKQAQVEVDGSVKAAINRGLLVFVGVEKGDGAADGDTSMYRGRSE